MKLSDQKAYLHLNEYTSDEMIAQVESELKQEWKTIPEVYQKVLSIYATNSSDGVFWFGSSINHSCVPNLDFALNFSIQKGTFHAIRDIQPGEELTVAYVDTTRRTKSQRLGLLKRWGIVCSCEACENTPQGIRRESKRVELYNLDRELAVHRQSHTEEGDQEALKCAQKIAAIQQAEGILDTSLAIS